MLSAIGIPEEKWGGEVATMNADNDAHRERAFALFDLVAASTDH